MNFNPFAMELAWMIFVHCIRYCFTENLCICLDLSAFVINRSISYWICNVENMCKCRWNLKMFRAQFYQPTHSYGILFIPSDFTVGTERDVNLITTEMITTQVQTFSNDIYYMWKIEVAKILNLNFNMQPENSPPFDVLYIYVGDGIWKMFCAVEIPTINTDHTQTAMQR